MDLHNNNNKVRYARVHWRSVGRSAWLRMVARFWASVRVLPSWPALHALTLLCRVPSLCSSLDRAQGGWLSSTKSFFSGVAKEVSSLVAPQSEAGRSHNGAGDFPPQQQQHQQQQQQPMPMQPNYGQPMPPQQYGQAGPYHPAPAPQVHPGGGGYAAPPSNDYLSQFDNVLNREIAPGSNGPYGGGGHLHSPSQSQAQAYSQVDRTWNDGEQDGILPVVPLSTQFAAASSRGNSRRGSLDGTMAQGGVGGPTGAAFPTGAFPTAPPSALSQQLPMGHPSYAPVAPRPLLPATSQPSPPPHANVHNISEFQGVTAVSGSPPPSSSPPPAFQPPFNPLMPQSAYPLQPHGAHAPINNAPPPQVFPVAPPRRVLDETSMNPTMNATASPQQPLANNAYAQSPATSPYRYGAAQPHATGSPAHSFASSAAPSGQMIPSGNGASSMPSQPMQQPMSMPSPSSSSGLLPPPPPVSSYWKQRAAVAGPATTEPAFMGRVDYSDLDYKSMDFAYNNRYDRDPASVAPTNVAPSQQPPVEQQRPAAYPAPQPSFGGFTAPPPSTGYASPPAQGNYSTFALGMTRR